MIRIRTSSRSTLLQVWSPGQAVVENLLQEILRLGPGEPNRPAGKCVTVVVDGSRRAYASFARHLHSQVEKAPLAIHVHELDPRHSLAPDAGVLLYRDPVV